MTVISSEQTTKKVFHKKVFSSKGLILQVFRVLLFLPATLLCFIAPRSSRALREKIVLGVTKVNQCRWCEWGHTHVAIHNNVDVEELNNFLLGVTDTKVTEAEGVAILFGQHAANQNGKIDAPSVEKLQQFYTYAQIIEIKAIVHTIYFGNLLGNTFDALLARFKGYQVDDSSLIIELICAVIALPIAVTGTCISHFNKTIKIRRLGEG